MVVVRLKKAWRGLGDWAESPSCDVLDRTAYARYGSAASANMFCRALSNNSYEGWSRDSRMISLLACRITRPGRVPSVIAPARHRAVGLHAAVVACPGADGDELPCWRCGLSQGVIAPAGHRAVGPHPAGVRNPRADGDELPCWRCSLTKQILAPAGDGAVGLHAAGVACPGADGGELRLRRGASLRRNYGLLR